MAVVDTVDTVDTYRVAGFWQRLGCMGQNRDLRHSQPTSFIGTSNHNIMTEKNLPSTYTGPGLVDLQVNGYAGIDFNSDDDVFTPETFHT